MDAPWIVVIASADRKHLSDFTDILRRLELEAICTSTVSECRDILHRQARALVFCDRTLPDGEYRDLIAAARSTNLRARFVLTSREVDWDEFMEANRAGAFHVMSAPYRPKEIEWVIIQAKRNDRQTMKKFLKSDSIDSGRTASESA